MNQVAKDKVLKILGIKKQLLLPAPKIMEIRLSENSLINVDRGKIIIPHSAFNEKVNVDKNMPKEDWTKVKVQNIDLFANVKTKSLVVVKKNKFREFFRKIFKRIFKNNTWKLKKK